LLVCVHVSDGSAWDVRRWDRTSETGLCTACARSQVDSRWPLLRLALNNEDRLTLIPGATALRILLLIPSIPAALLVSRLTRIARTSSSKLESLSCKVVSIYKCNCHSSYHWWEIHLQLPVCLQAPSFLSLETILHLLNPRNLPNSSHTFFAYRTYSFCDFLRPWVRNLIS